MRVFTVGFLGCLVLAGCSSQRKLSRIETREPAAVRSVPALSALRARLVGVQKFSAHCPSEVRQLLPVLILEKVRPPACPERLTAAFAAVRGFLRLEELSAVEGLLGGQCRSLASFDESLIFLMQEQQTSPTHPGGRENFATHVPVNEEEVAMRAALRNELFAEHEVHEPFSQWVRVNGEYVLTEDLLGLLEPLVTGQSCRLSDQEVDQSFRTLHSLEELVRIYPEGDPQRVQEETLLRGIHKIVERKIQEFFRP
ncbi:MAG TPA: hypothetical protein VIH99_07070 [Bdellovibrionota bacterium]